VVVRLLIRATPVLFYENLYRSSGQQLVPMAGLFSVKSQWLFPLMHLSLSVPLRIRMIADCLI
jgi:hypothetical protein